MATDAVSDDIASICDIGEIADSPSSPRRRQPITVSTTNPLRDLFVPVKWRQFPRDIPALFVSHNVPNRLQTE